MNPQTKKEKELKETLDMLLKGQREIIDILKLIIYNQCPERKNQFFIKEDELKAIVKRFEL